MQRRISQLALGQTLGVVVRYGILSAQLGLAAGAGIFFATCIGGCGGYAEVIWAYASGILAALASFIGLLIRYALLKDAQARLRREAQWQWLWISITTFVAMAFM